MANKNTSAKFLSALLVTTAFTVPAFAEGIETVVVTAEKRAEDIQTVPIAVTEISGDVLRQKEIQTYKDLQFNVPNVTFAKTGLGNGIITIRGVGQAAGDPGVAQYQDGVYSESADTAAATYFDVGNVEVLRGPQGTLYGRGSVGGLINVIGQKPDLDAFQAQGEVTYGEYATVRSDGVVNIPIIDGKLAVRIAGELSQHNGYITNIAPGQQNQNGQNIFALRGSVRWQPTDNTTIDVVANYSNEADTRTRGDNTECQRDPTGVIGCLPGGLGFQPSNGYANALGILTSKQTFGNFGFLVGQGTASALGVNATTVPSAYSTSVQSILCALGPANACVAGVGFGDISGATLGAGLGAYAGGHSVVNNTTINNILLAGYVAAAQRATLTDLTVLNGPGSANVGAQIPQSLFQINTPFTPQFHENNQHYSFHLNHRFNDWLTSDVIVGYSAQNRSTSNSYTNQPGEDFSGTLATSVPALEQFAILAGNSAAKVGNLAADYFSHFGPGGQQEIPLSNPTPGGIADLTNGIQKFTYHSEASDLEISRSRETSVEWRFASNFDGPLNFTAGLFYWSRNTSVASYRVTFSGGDYFSLFAGSAFAGSAPGSQPYVGVDPMYYQNAPSSSDSKAAFADFTYQAIPDLLTFRAGLRWTEDRDYLNGDHTSFTGLQSPIPAACAATGFCFLPASTNSAATVAAANAYLHATGTYTSSDTSLVNYRAVAEYTPKLDFTDQTMIYASYALGSKPGNVNLIPAAVTALLPATFKPEELTAYELGTKNTLLDGTLQANLTAWYYDYKNFQYTVVAFSTLYTQNFGAHMWGEEAELIWQPDEHWSFNANLTNSDSSIGNFFAVDARNPTAGKTNAVLIKDIGLGGGDTPGQNCVVVTSTGLSPADDPAVTAAFGGRNPFIAPAGGSAALRGTANTLGNIQYANFGTCTADFAAVGLGASYHYSNAAQDGAGSSPTGIATALKGKQILNLPPNTVAFGAQYTFNFGDGYRLVPRADYYYQSGYFSRVFNDPVDSVGSWDQLNVQIQLNAPDDRWFAKVFATNVLDKKSLQAIAPASDTSGLYSTVFLEDPRVIGVTLGAKW